MQHVRDAEVSVERVPLASLKAYDGNAKRHDNANIEAIEASIKEFGFRNPIIAWHNEDGVPEIVAGHGRALAAQRLGIQEVPVVFVDDLSDAQRRMLTLADNQTTMMSGWREKDLAEELDRLCDVFDVEDFGFSLSEDLDEVAGEVEADEDFALPLDYSRNYIVISIENDTDWMRAQTVFDLKKGKRWATNANGTGGGDTRLNRVVKWDDFARMFLG
nr:MAG TPA: ParB protein [Caudoviricetes sp.]